MNKWILLSFSVLVLFTIGQGLVCRVCDIKFGKYCFDSKAPCQASEGQFCETTEVYLGSLRFYSKYGCGTFAELCNKTEYRDNPQDMNLRRTCCNFDLCNG